MLLWFNCISILGAIVSTTVLTVLTQKTVLCVIISCDEYGLSCTYAAVMHQAKELPTHSNSVTHYAFITAHSQSATQLWYNLPQAKESLDRLITGIGIWNFHNSVWSRNTFTRPLLMRQQPETTNILQSLGEMMLCYFGHCVLTTQSRQHCWLTINWTLLIPFICQCILHMSSAAQGYKKNA